MPSSLFINYDPLHEVGQFHKGFTGFFNGHGPPPLLGEIGHHILKWESENLKDPNLGPSSAGAGAARPLALGGSLLHWIQFAIFSRLFFRYQNRFRILLSAAKE